MIALVASMLLCLRNYALRLVKQARICQVGRRGITSSKEEQIVWYRLIVIPPQLSGPHERNIHLPPFDCALLPRSPWRWESHQELSAATRYPATHVLHHPLGGQTFPMMERKPKKRPNRDPIIVAAGRRNLHHPCARQSKDPFSGIYNSMLEEVLPPLVTPVFLGRRSERKGQYNARVAGGLV